MKYLKISKEKENYMRRRCKVRGKIYPFRGTSKDGSYLKCWVCASRDIKKLEPCLYCDEELCTDFDDACNICVAKATEFKCDVSDLLKLKQKQHQNNKKELSKK